MEGFRAHYRDCPFYSYPDRSGDLRRVTQISDWCSARQWHSSGIYCDYFRAQEFEHQLALCLPGPPGSYAGSGRTIRMAFFRGPGRDFSERDRALLALLRPHLHRAYLNAERRRKPTPQLTPGSGSCCAWSPPGAPTPRSPASQLGLSEGTVRIHLQNMYARLQVPSRTAAVTRAFPDLAAT